MQTPACAMWQLHVRLNAAPAALFSPIASCCYCYCCCYRLFCCCISLFLFVSLVQLSIITVHCACAPQATSSTCVPQRCCALKIKIKIKSNSSRNFCENACLLLAAVDSVRIFAHIWRAVSAIAL